MDILTCLFIGVAGGILSGLMGVGGGIILIPLMIIFLKMNQHQAQGTSLAIITLSLFSMLVYYKKGHVNLGIAALIGIGFIAGGFIGAYFATSMSENILRKCFAVLMIIIACKMLFFK
ncbi:MAG: sulfite exporter TauE/SafE family protein [Endomicrobia bacterium]|nr:sulfite exporter TauE/SafE family protein [Endomicrobiia bacterium]